MGLADHAALEDALAATLEHARRRWAAFRPEVARYLFDHGLRPAAEALAGSDPALLDALFRLQLESIGARSFGVSTDHWRDNPAYPDRYFPIVWLDLVPKILPLLPPERRLPTLVALFNLGENLVVAAPAAAGLVAEALLASASAVVDEGVEPVALAAMVSLGILPKEAAPARRPAADAFRTVARVAVASVAAWEPTLIPGAVAFSGDGTIDVFDRVRALALRLARVGATLRLAGRSSAEAATHAPSPLPVVAGAIAVTAEGVVEHEGRRIGCIDPRGVCGVAVSARGLVAITRRFSQQVELWALAP